MSDLIGWLESHESLSGWAQFFGAMLALVVTYITAFAPHWRRRTQLKRAATRLLQNGYEALESYYRTSEKFLPFPISIRAAGLTMVSVANEIDRFPIFELSDQGPRSLARSLVAVSGQLRLTNLMLEPIAEELESREGTLEDQRTIREFVGGQLKLTEDIISGKQIERPQWPAAKKGD